MVKKAVVYGAGQSGRGYLARYLIEAGYQITFIEVDNDLIETMTEDKCFTIHFYHKDRSPFIVKGFKILSIKEDLSSVLKNTDMILTAVGEQNLADVAKSIGCHLSIDELPQLLTAENGTNPANVLRKELEKIYQAPVLKKVSQTAIFCSTVNVNQTRLDILSQNETYFPYDKDGFEGELDFPGAEPRSNFEYFFERKIYTYNCLAGLISYLGYVKNYKVYSEAANDPEIAEIIDQLLEELNPSLAKYFNISLEEQADFSNKAVEKFKDHKILDYVIKNGRAPIRKLGPSERIFAPYQILKENNYDLSIMCLVAAGALIYLEELEWDKSQSFNPKEVLKNILDLDKENLFIIDTCKAYKSIINERENVRLLNIIEDLRMET